jgi:hypothetical protein
VGSDVVFPLELIINQKFATNRSHPIHIHSEGFKSLAMDMDGMGTVGA